MKISGVYIIQSRVKPNKIYIGSSIDITKRWGRHLSSLRLGKHSNPILQNHVNKYGIEDLKFSILEKCDRTDLLIREQYYIDKYEPSFNVLKKAYSTLGHKGRTYTKHQKQDLSNKLMERTWCKKFLDDPSII